MKKYLLLALFQIVSCTLSAQDSLKIVSFQLTNKLIPASDQKEDGAKKPCGYIIVEYQGRNKIDFDGRTLGHKKNSDGTYLVYIINGGKYLKVRPEGGYYKEIPLPEDGVGGNEVYYLVLKDANEEPPTGGKDTFKWIKKWEREQLNENNWSIGISEKYMFKDLPINLSIHGAYVTNYVPIELEATLGLKKSSGTYIYDSNGTLKDSYEYTGLRLTARSGYCFEIDKNKRFMITPLGGFSYNVLFGSQIKSASSMQVHADASSSGANTSEAKKWGDGGNAVSFVGGLRFSYAINEHWLIHAMPEYNVNIWKDNNFNFISKADDGVKAWSDGFNISVGLIFRWEH